MSETLEAITHDVLALPCNQRLALARIILDLDAGPTDPDVEAAWDEVTSRIRWILANPTVPRLRPGDFRRVNLHSYPYYIAYALRGDRVVLLAIGHGARRPEYWTGRKP